MGLNVLKSVVLKKKKKVAKKEKRKRHIWLRDFLLIKQQAHLEFTNVKGNPFADCSRLCIRPWKKRQGQSVETNLGHSIGCSYTYVQYKCMLVFSCCFETVVIGTQIRHWDYMISLWIK